jgi:hypothetical protein
VAAVNVQKIDQGGTEWRALQIVGSVQRRHHWTSIAWGTGCRQEKWSKREILILHAIEDDAVLLQPCRGAQHEDPRTAWTVATGCQLTLVDGAVDHLEVEVVSPTKILWTHPFRVPREAKRLKFRDEFSSNNPGSGTAKRRAKLWVPSAVFIC